MKPIRQYQTQARRTCQTLSVVVTGAQGTVSYVWFKDGEPIESGPSLATLELCPVSTDMAGVYVCEISDAVMTIQTAPFRVSVTPRLPVGPAVCVAVLLLILFTGARMARQG